MSTTEFSDVYEEASPNGRTEETPPEDPYAQQEVKPDEVQPTQHFARSSGADFFTWCARGLGTVLIQSGKDVPVGRTIAFQAPITGNRLDKLIAHSWVDGLLQPLFRKTSELEGLGAIIALPLLIGMYERSPGMAPMIGEMLKPAVYATFNELAPILQKQRTEDRRVYRKVANLNEIFDLPKDADPFDAFMSAVFGQPEEPDSDGQEAA
jgi:hypothetical protein